MTSADRVVTHFLIIYLSVYPLLVLVYIAFIRGRVSENTNQRFDSFFEGISNEKGRPPFFSILIFLVRRIIVACTLTLIPNYPCAQLMILIISSLTILVF